MFDLESVVPVVLQGSVLAAVGYGLSLLRDGKSSDLHPVLASHPRLSTKYPTLAELTSQLSCMGNEPAFHKIARTICMIEEFDDKGGPSAQWHIQSLSLSVVREMKHMCSHVPTRSDELFRSALRCREEVIPAIEEQLENLLHNHIQERSYYR